VGLDPPYMEASILSQSSDVDRNHAAMRKADQARRDHARMNAAPPRGVIMPNLPMPVSVNAYRLSLKSNMWINKSGCPILRGAKVADPDPSGVGQGQIPEGVPSATHRPSLLRAFVTIPQNPVFAPVTGVIYRIPAAYRSPPTLYG